MKTFPTGTNSEKNRKRGASPFYILECPFPSTGTIFLADYAITTTSWKGGITTLPWIANWGKIVENIASDQALTKTSTFSLDVIIDPRYPLTDIEATLETAANNPEITDCFLYRAYRDLIGPLETTDPPQLVWAGNFIDWEKIDDLTMRCEMVDRSVRIDKYIGTKLSLTSYPDACLDDIGKMINIVYGANNMVTGLRSAWGSKTTVKTLLTNTATSVELSDSSQLPASGTILVDEEQITFTGNSSNTLTGCTRGAHSTTAVQHGVGSIVWEVLNQYDSILAGHALRAITTAYALIDGYLLRVTSGISNLVSGGVHLLRASSQISVAPLSDIDVSLSDSGHVHNMTSSSGMQCSSPYLINGSYWSWTGTANNLVDGSDITYVRCSCTSHNADDWARMRVTCPAYSGTISAVYAKVTHQSTVSGSWEHSGIFISGTDMDYSESKRLDNSNTKVTQIIYIGTSIPTYLYFMVYHDGGAYYTMSSTCFEIELVVIGSGTGSATTGATVASTGGVVYTRFVERFCALVDGYADDVNGTITGTASALIERPDHVVKHFLYTYVSWPLASFYSDAATEFSTTYKFSAVLKEYNTLKFWLAKMAWESRCWFRLAPTRAELLLRPDSLTSDKTITDLMIASDGGGKTSIRIRRSPLDEIINKIALHYDRDATKDGDEAYRALIEVSDAVSIARYSEYEKPDLFYFDFVQDATMADDVADFYLARLAYRKKLIELTLYLDNAELEFADAITIASLANLLCEIEQANLAPGSAREMRNDTITIIAKEY